MLFRTFSTCVVLLTAMTAGPAFAGDATNGLKEGAPALKSIGPLAFGPNGILFIGDPQGAAIFAIDTGTAKGGAAAPVHVKGIDGKISALLGTTEKDILINGLAVNPLSGDIYL